LFSGRQKRGRIIEESQSECRTEIGIYHDRQTVLS
jgi:hypothetical protein